MKPDNEEKRKINIPLETFLENLRGRINEDSKIENEDQLKIAQGRQKMEHRDRRLEAELEKSKNQIEELKTDRSLKKKVAKAVFGLLFLETIFLFIILLLQGFSYRCFHIEDTTLNIFVPVTILQISSMAIIITKYLFSVKR